MDQPAKKSAGQSRTRTRSELAHHVQEKLGEALHQLEKLSVREHFRRHCGRLGTINVCVVLACEIGFLFAPFASCRRRKQTLVTM